MARVKKNNQSKEILGFEDKLRHATGKLYGYVDAVEYKHRAKLKIRPSDLTLEVSALGQT